MNSVERTALLFHRDTIVQNVDLAYIKEKLLAYGILNHEELEEIDYEKTRSAKIRKLLDLLPRKGPQAFNKFVKTLEADYSWLSEKLVKFSNPDSPDASSHDISCHEGDIRDSLTAILQEALITGGIPFPPPYLVPREEKLNHIRQCLRQMVMGQFIVLHGMAGTGKSVLAAEAVRDVDLMVNTFNSNIYWLTIGQTDKDTLLTRMQALCERLDYTGVPPLSVDQASERLRRLMSDPRRKNSLLILDDVWRGEVVRAFDLGCKVLLTTRDATVMDVVQGRAELIRIQDGFTQQESMTYLAKCLQLTEQELPHQAYQIYSESKGSPMVLSILAPVLADRRSPQRIDPGRWDHYVGKLRDRKYTEMKRQDSYSYETINLSIGISFDHLDDKIRNLLNDFVIFLDDVNIPAQVLEVLWNMSLYEVEENMMILLKKSLIAHHVNEQNYTVLYGIHDLLLDYLKSKMSDEEKQVVHGKLIDAYVAKCDGDFGSLPNDNYIFWFLGYHLYKADYRHLFPKIYLDLKFILAKLRATGPSDLLNDYRKYVDYISGKNGEYLQHVEDFSRFIRTCGHIVVQCPVLDIVQLALQQPRNSQVYLSALEMAHESKNGFYLDWCNRTDARGQVLRSTVLNPGQVTAACFTDDGKRVLSAVGDNLIRMLDADSGRELHRFTGHNGSVHHLALSCDSRRMVSSSADGTVKIWDLQSVIRKLDDTLQRPTKTPSPRVRQISWHNMYDISDRNVSDESTVTYAGHTNEVLYSQFSRNGALIVSCGMDHTARVWLSTAPMELGSMKHPEQVNTCCFSPEGIYIATGCTDSKIRIWSASNYSCVAMFDERCSRVLFVSFLSETSLLSVSDTEILLWNWRYPNGQDDTSPSYSVNPIGSSSHAHCYQSAAIDDNRQLLAVATSKENIIVFNIVLGCQVLELVGHHGSISSLHFAPTTDENGAVPLLLSGSLDETVMVWNVNLDRTENRPLSATAFHAVWSPEKPDLFRMAAAESNNAIQVMTGLDGQSLYTTEAESEVIEQCAISHGMAMLAWGTEGGSIRLLSLKTKSVKVVGVQSNRRMTHLKFSPTDVLLMSASEDGCIKIWKHDGDCVTVWGPRKGVVGCHFVDHETQLLICGVDGSVRMWRVDNGHPTAVLLQDIGLHVICFDLSADGVSFAQGTSSHGLQLISVNTDLKKLNRQPMRLGHQKSPVRVCRFNNSHTRPLVAVGYDSGVIEVYDYTRHLLHSTLEAHRSWVRDLRFVSNSPFFQLVSVGDRMAWWNLVQTKPPQPSTNGNSSLLLAPLSPNFDPYNIGSLDLTDDRTRGPIQTFDFQDRFASKLFVSPDGQIVLTVTDSGILYILRQLEPET